MKGELLYAYHPVRSHIMWAVAYVILLAVSITGFFLLASRVGTHSIPAGEVQLVIPYSKYLVGENITFTIKNNFNSAISVVNNCPSEPLEVYKQDGSRWVRIHDLANLSDCPSENRIINVPANGSSSGTFAAWNNLFATPGKYRVVAYVEYYNALPYQEFEVISKPEIPKPVQSPSTNNGGSAGGGGGSRAGAGSQNSQTKTVSTSGGSITVSYTSSYITVTSINPAAGYIYEGGRSGAQVEITFKGGNEIQIHMEIQNGQLIVQTEQGG